MATTALVPVSKLSSGSMAMESAPRAGRSSMKKKQSQEDQLNKMKANLIRFSRTSDKRMLLKSLKSMKFLSSLELDRVQQDDYSISDLENEMIQQTTMDVNGLSFLKAGCGLKAGKNSLTMLKMFCDDLCSKKHVKVHPRAMYKDLITRMAPSTSSADPYFRLNSLLGSPELLAMPITSGKKTVPIDLNLFESGGSVHMRMTETFQFGLFRKSDVKSVRPWIVIDAVVTERANFGNNSCTRFLSLVLPETNS
eukprot:scaffold1736_cov127-Cylindrotheca_fusiformis.AAC.95